MTILKNLAFFFSKYRSSDVAPLKRLNLSKKTTQLPRLWLKSGLVGPESCSLITTKALQKQGCRWVALETCSYDTLFLFLFMRELLSTILRKTS